MRNTTASSFLFFLLLPLAAAALSPGQQQYILEKAKLEKMRSVAFQADPRLKLLEAQTAALQAHMKKRQEETREAIDRYLTENKQTHEDLAKYRLDAITDLLLRINPYRAVSDPKLKEIVIGALRKAPPVNPAEFAKQFPGKKPAEIPPDALLQYHKTQLKIEADKAQVKLGPLVKSTAVPAFMIEAMDEITMLKSVLTVCRAYIDANTPAELKAQQALVTRMEKK